MKPYLSSTKTNSHLSEDCSDNISNNEFDSQKLVQKKNKEKIIFKIFAKL